MAYADALQLLEVQTELASWWLSARGRAFAEGWERDRAARSGLHGRTLSATRESDALITAEPYWIAEDMLALASHAAKTMPRQTFLETDLPARRGLCVFERGVFVLDRWGKKVGYRGFLWSVCDIQVTRTDGTTDGPKPGVYLSMYADRDAPDDYFTDEEAIRQFRPYLPKLVLAHSTAFVFGQDPVWTHPIQSDASLPPDVLSGVSGMVGLPLCLWTLIQQPIATVSRVRGDRASRRRLARQRSPVADREINVVTLRRLTVKSEGGEPREVEWSHRWLVRGHWRNVWHPSIKEHRLQWIHPFVKGPDDKPFVAKATVSELVR